MSTLEFSHLFEKAKKPLFSFALKLTKNEEAAKDLVQEASYKAYYHRARFQPGTNFQAWIYTILRNTFINQYRKAKTRNMETISVEDNLFWLANRAGDGDASSDMSYRDILGLLDQLDETYRTPFLMFYKGYQYDEIAEAINIPMGTVKSRIFYARKKLRSLLRQHKMID